MLFVKSAINFAHPFAILIVFGILFGLIPPVIQSMVEYPCYLIVWLELLLNKEKYKELGRRSVIGKFLVIFLCICYLPLACYGIWTVF